MATTYAEFIKQNPNYVGAVAPQRQAPQQPVPAPKQKGKGGTLTSLISELGGGTGAAGGAAIGTALLPGVGTLAGAILGGFLGGTTGRGIENKVRDDQNFFGKGGSARSALGEGALAGALSGVGEGFQLAKGARAASNAAKLGIEGVEGTKQGILEGAGRSLKAGAGGYGIGATATGERQLTASGSQAIEDTLRKLKISPSSPENMATKLDNFIKGASSTLEKQYSKGATKLSSTELSGLADDITTRIMDHPDIGPNLSKSARQAVDQKVKQLLKADDTSKLWQFTKDIESKGINFGANPSAKMVDREAVNRIFREGIRDTLNNKVPGVANTNSLYHDAKTAQTFVLNAAKDKTGGLSQRLFSLSPVKTAEAKLGSALQSVGAATKGTARGAVTGPLSLVTNQAVRQAPGGLARAIMGSTQGTGSSQQDLAAEYAADPTNPKFLNVDPAQFGYPPDDGTMQTTPSDMYNSIPEQQESQTPPQSAYSLEQAIQDIHSTNNPKTQAQIMDYYNFVNKAEAAQAKARAAANSSGPNTTKVTAQQYSLAQRGQQSLKQMAELLQRDPGVLNRSATPGRKLPGVGGFISNAAKTGDFDAVGYNIASSLLRIETGAQANESEIKNLQTQMMPRAGDSPETVARKLQQLNQAFSVIINAANNKYAETPQDLTQGAY